MDNVNAGALLRDVEAFLSQACPAVARETSDDTAADLAYWNEGNRITASDFDTLGLLEGEPLQAEAIAEVTGRDAEVTRRLLNALAAIGVVERAAGGYRNTLAAHLYLQALGEQVEGRLPFTGRPQ